MKKIILILIPAIMSAQSPWKTNVENWNLPDSSLRQKEILEVVVGSYLLMRGITVREDRSISNLRASDGYLAIGIYLNIHAFRIHRELWRRRNPHKVRRNRGVEVY